MSRRIPRNLPRTSKLAAGHHLPLPGPKNRVRARRRWMPMKAVLLPSESLVFHFECRESGEKQMTGPGRGILQVHHLAPHSVRSECNSCRSSSVGPKSLPFFCTQFTRNRGLARQAWLTRRRSLRQGMAAHYVANLCKAWSMILCFAVDFCECSDLAAEQLCGMPEPAACRQSLQPVRHVTS